MASLGWVTPGAATEGVTPLFFPEKPGDLFLVASSAVSPLISSSQNLSTFFAHRFLLLHSAVTPLEGVTLHLFYLSDLVSPLFFVNLPTKFFFLRVSPPWRVSPGAVRPPPLVTPLFGPGLSPLVVKAKICHCSALNAQQWTLTADSHKKAMNCSVTNFESNKPHQTSDIPTVLSEQWRH